MQRLQKSNLEKLYCSNYILNLLGWCKNNVDFFSSTLNNISAHSTLIYIEIKTVIDINKNDICTLKLFINMDTNII